MDTARPKPSARELRREEATWVAERLQAAWGSVEVVSRGRLIDPATLPGVVVESGTERVGLATYDVVGDACELVTINAFVAAWVSAPPSRGGVRTGALHSGVGGCG